MTPLEMAILNMMELAAIEDAPPFARLLRRGGSGTSGANAIPVMAQSLMPVRHREEDALTTG